MLQFHEVGVAVGEPAGAFPFPAHRHRLPIHRDLQRPVAAEDRQRGRGEIHPRQRFVVGDNHDRGLRRPVRPQTGQTRPVGLLSREVRCAGVRFAVAGETRLPFAGPAVPRNRRQRRKQPRRAGLRFQANGRSGGRENGNRRNRNAVAERQRSVGAAHGSGDPHQVLQPLADVRAGETAAEAFAPQFRTCESRQPQRQTRHETGPRRTVRIGRFQQFACEKRRPRVPQLDGGLQSTEQQPGLQGDFTVDEQPFFNGICKLGSVGRSTRRFRNTGWIARSRSQPDGRRERGAPQRPAQRGRQLTADARQHFEHHEKFEGSRRRIGNAVQPFFETSFAEKPVCRFSGRSIGGRGSRNAEALRRTFPSGAFRSRAEGLNDVDQLGGAVRVRECPGRPQRRPRGERLRHTLPVRLVGGDAAAALQLRGERLHVSRFRTPDQRAAGPSAPAQRLQEFTVGEIVRRPRTRSEGNDGWLHGESMSSESVSRTFATASIMNRSGRRVERGTRRKRRTPRCERDARRAVLGDSRCAFPPWRGSVVF